MIDVTDKRYISRKWLLTLAVLVIAIVARALTWIDGDQLVSLITWIVGLYMVGNVGGMVAGNVSITSKT